MARPRKSLGEFTVDLLVADEPTAAGHVFSAELLGSIANAINMKPVTLEELSPIERKVKGIPLCYSWPEHAMATSRIAVVDNGRLRVTFTVNGSKYGKLLMSTIDSAGGVENIVFKPVAIGDVDPNNNILPGYSVQYVTFSLGNQENGNDSCDNRG